jgi:ABC-2 type transport system permease protein
MGTIRINIINELEKNLTKRGMKVYFSLILLMPFLIILLSEKIQSIDMLVLPTVNLTYAMLKGYVMVIIPVFIFVAVADTFSGELERGTLFSVRPIERIEIYYSKIIALGIMIFIHLLIFFTITSISVLLFGRNFQLSDFGSLLLSTFVSWFPLVAFTILAAFISQWFKSSAATVGVGILTYVLMFVVPFVIPKSLYLFPSSYLDWYQLWSENVSVQWMIQSSLYLFSFSTLFFAIGYYMFKSKEV